MLQGNQTGPWEHGPNWGTASQACQGGWQLAIWAYLETKGGFLGSSAGKESACNTGDPGLIPGSGRFPEEGIGYPHQYSWALLVTQTVNNLPAMQETWVQSQGWEDPLEKGKAIHSSILAWRIPWTEKPGRLQSMGLQRVGHNWAILA